IYRGVTVPTDFNRADLPLLDQLAGVNAIRTYPDAKGNTPFEHDLSLLDSLATRHVDVILGLSSKDPNLTAKIKKYSRYANVSMYMLDNEPNLVAGNSKAAGKELETKSQRAALKSMKTALLKIKAIDPTRPVAMSWGGLPYMEFVDGAVREADFPSDVFAGLV